MRRGLPRGYLLRWHDGKYCRHHGHGISSYSQFSLEHLALDLDGVRGYFQYICLPMPSILRVLRKFSSLAVVALLLGSCDDRSDESFKESDARFRIIKESVYNMITVERDGDIVDMKFRLGKGASRQTAVNLSDPTDLVIPLGRCC